jgi:hypothetical protein
MQLDVVKSDSPASIVTGSKTEEYEGADRFAELATPNGRFDATRSTSPNRKSYLCRKWLDPALLNFVTDAEMALLTQ